MFGPGNTSTTQSSNTSGSSGLLGKLGKLAGGGNTTQSQSQAQPPMDPLDKAVAFAEQKISGKGTQSNSPASRVKTEKISDALRSGYKKVSGSDIPIKDT